VLSASRQRDKACSGDRQVEGRHNAGLVLGVSGQVLCPEGVQACGSSRNDLMMYSSNTLAVAW
jgi:hypothetical protein